MPTCYMLCVCTGSSVDQHSNNVSLFNLVEQVSIPPEAPPPPPGAMIPIEAHAYWLLKHEDIGRDLEVRYVMVDVVSALETISEPVKHRSVTLRMRSRIVGIPLPPVLGDYELRVDWRYPEAADWHRQTTRWPLRIQETSSAPRVTH